MNVPVVVARRWSCRVATAYFEEPEPPVRADVVRLIQLSDRPRAPATSFFTILIDLERDPAALLAAMKDGTRSRIRRAGARDGLTYVAAHPPDATSLERFCALYDRFAAGKALPPADRGHLRRLAEAGALDLSCVRCAGEDLVWHAHCRDGRRATLLASASLFRALGDSAARNLVGRANRWHHWRDMLRFRAGGLQVYDFGGWYPGADDRERLDINRFKEEFGGTVVEQFNCEVPLTLRGRLALRLRDWLRSGRAQRARSGRAQRGRSGCAPR